MPNVEKYRDVEIVPSNCPTESLKLSWHVSKVIARLTDFVRKYVHRMAIMVSEYLEIFPVVLGVGVMLLAGGLLARR